MKISKIVKITITSVLLLFFAFVSANADKKPQFVGSETCKECHRKTTRSWGKTKMALAFEILKPGERKEAKLKFKLDPQKDYTQEEKCLPCHTTGYGKPGGFVSAKETPLHLGVGCEACHGPGSLYNPIMEIRGRIYKLDELIEVGLIPQAMTTCRDCHNTDSPTFTKEAEAAFDADKSKEASHKTVQLKYHLYTPGEKERLILEYNQGKEKTQ